MGFRIDTAAVIGSGVMGGGIAGLLANVGIKVYLLDIAPTALDEKEAARGLTLNDPSVRNRIVNAGLDRVVKATPPVLFTPGFADRIQAGNLEDNLEWIGDVDWVVEVAVEDLSIKQDLMARVEKACKPGSIISSNTSGIPIGEIVKGRSSDFASRFLGTHFFNPPRSMKLLEIIPAKDTDAGVVEFMTGFGESVLGKGVVLCKDTPNFVANRLAWVPVWHDLEYTMSEGYTVEEVDAMTGPLVGRPATATYRLHDLVGFDISTKIAENLYPMIPHDLFRENLMLPHGKKLRERMIEKGLLGRKAGQGFYKMERTAEGRKFLGLDLETVEYRDPAPVNLPRIKEAAGISDLGERLRFLISEKDRTGEYVWASLSTYLAYAAACIPEIADDIRPIDGSLKWGYAHQMGPFEIWDALGVSGTCERMESDGLTIASWVKTMLAAGHTTFYGQDRGSVSYYSAAEQRSQTIPANDKIIVLEDLGTEGKVVEERQDASLVDIGDGVACLEIHTGTANVITGEASDMLLLALEKVDANFDGLVVCGSGRNFSTGADLNMLVDLFSKAQETGDFSEVEESITRSQQLRQAYRFYHKPIVAATFGMTAAGGAELALSASAVCAHAESFFDLSSAGLGLLPSACGCKEMLRRVVSPVMKTPGVDPRPFVQKVFDTIAFGMISTSAENARGMGFVGAEDRIIMNRDFLIAEAKRMVVDKAKSGYRPPTRGKSIYAAGRDELANLRVAIYLLGESGAASEYDMKIAEKLAYVLCGGELSYPQWVDEEYILGLEREAFVSVAGEIKTLERIKHMLATGKVLRN
jgi:3-hydroxyacyl-CoA dehydrogenase